MIGIWLLLICACIWAAFGPRTLLTLLLLGPFVIVVLIVTWIYMPSQPPLRHSIDCTDPGETSSFCQVKARRR